MGAFRVRAKAAPVVLPAPGGIDLVRVLSGYMDIGADDFET
jgi:hypothetical protein